MDYAAGLTPETYLSGERLTVVLGYVTLTAVLAVIFSCRSFVSLSSHLGVKDVLKNRTYRLFYQFHSYYWWGFWFVFVFHLYMAGMHIFMIPAEPDPDAYLHWYSLGFGLGAVAVIVGITLSCRVLIDPLNLIFNKKPLNNPRYRVFYKAHSYYWLFFLAIMAAHYSFGFLHSGLWPY
jgi:hypothetical protein